MSSIKHVAIIMDGNGRWAKERGRPRVWGHVRGSNRVLDIVVCAANLGLESLTLYAFSTENWSRPKEEVVSLFKLLRKFLRKEKDNLIKNNIRFNVIGNYRVLDNKIVEVVDEIIEETRSNTGLNLSLAINYGGRTEIVDAVNDFLKVNRQKEITEEDIAGVVARWTGIPVERMLEEEAKKLARMERELRERIIGQNDAVKKISDTIRRSRTGISDPDRPIGSFIFLGPTGVGKTELTKALAKFMFDDEKSLIRIDMSEFMEKHSISKLIGSPPGYVGHEEGGNFTEIVRHRPYSVVLFDEIEKAHPEVFNILLQVLDNGRLTDAKGRTVNFKNTVIIMTSNIGAEHIDQMEKMGFDQGRSAKNKYDEVKNNVEKALKEHFRPEFLNRLDDIVIFDILDEDSIKKIVSIQVDLVRERLLERGIKLKVVPAVLSYLAKEGYDPHYGARPLKRLIQTKILNPLAQLIVAKGVKDKDTVSVGFKNNQFTFDVITGKKKVIFKEKDITEEALV